jgi:uncharacterized protein (TIGR04255 family)
LTNKDGHIKKLPKAPLQEVVFELLWEIGADAYGNPIDHNFEMAQGVFRSSIIRDFPVQKRTIPENAPFKVYPKAVHQFWKEESVWPVVQLGPGILAVNDTEKNYEWENSFFPLIRDTMEVLEKSYEESLTYINASLRYIDAVTLPDSNALSFINENFNINISNDFEPDGELNQFSLSQSFSLQDQTQLSVIVSNGIDKFDKPAVIWQTYIFSLKRRKKEEVVQWLNYAHQTASDTFKKTIRPTFYDTFK